MAISVFDLFKVGLGPSSSHTVGPMKAAFIFLRDIEKSGFALSSVNRVQVELYGSLALTGVGHGTDRAVILGLEGYEADKIDPFLAKIRPTEVFERQEILLAGCHSIHFTPSKNIVFLRRRVLPHHPNGLIFKAYFSGGEFIERKYYSIGGGFVVDEGLAAVDELTQGDVCLPKPFKSGRELVDTALRSKVSIAEVMKANERVWRKDADIEAGLSNIWKEMNLCIERGLLADGCLPGGLKLKRRAKSMFEKLSKNAESSLRDPLTILDWVNLYALAVNEENASGSRVVTAPTNGSAGVIPAVLRYYKVFCLGDDRGVEEFLLTAAAIGVLYAENASISGAEVGCQGEVGVACSMAAAGLAAVLGGSVEQVEQAAEIGMEHNLGLTCDPIGGLVQIPCIERNAMGAVKAINAARIALGSSGSHYVSLDSVIKTMRQTGKDMKEKYKETSRGGLAVNVTEC